MRSTPGRLFDLQSPVTQTLATRTTLYRHICTGLRRKMLYVHEPFPYPSSSVVVGWGWYLFVWPAAIELSPCQMTSAQPETTPPPLILSSSCCAGKPRTAPHKITTAGVA
jgi:hypothetical protein